jgi:hypothetical protein
VRVVPLVGAESQRNVTRLFIGIFDGGNDLGC